MEKPNFDENDECCSDTYTKGVLEEKPLVAYETEDESSGE